VQLGAQLALVLLMAFAMGVGANAQWKWLPVSWLFFIGFVCGLGLLSAALDVYVRDLRYVVGVRQSGAVLAGADLVWFRADRARVSNALRLQSGGHGDGDAPGELDAQPPAASLLWNLAFASVVMLCVGWGVFSLVKRRFNEYL